MYTTHYNLSRVAKSGFVLLQPITWAKVYGCLTSRTELKAEVSHGRGTVLL